MLLEGKMEEAGKGVFMSSLKRLFRKLWDVYPNEPLVYICSHNGVTGAVRAEDFDDEVRRMRGFFRKKGKPSGVVRPQVYPVFLFSDKTPSSRSFRVGTLDDLKLILESCAVEHRTFELPPLNAPGMTPYGYFGVMEEIGRENTRHRLWSRAQAHNYLHGGAISTYNL